MNMSETGSIRLSADVRYVGEGSDFDRRWNQASWHPEDGLSNIPPDWNLMSGVSFRFSILMDVEISERFDGRYYVVYFVDERR